MKRGQRQRIEEIPTARPGEKPRSPKRGRLPRHDFPISLKHVARHVGRLRGLIHLARHCHDERIQQMVAAWDGLAAYQRPSTTLAQLCEAAEIEPRAFLAELVRTAWDFNHKNRLEDVTRGIGGRQGLIDLARECEDGRIKAMVDVWDSLGCKARKRTQLATLCAMHGVKRRDFLAEVVTTLWDLNVDVSTLLRVIAGPLAARRTLRTPPRPKGPLPPLLSSRYRWSGPTSRRPAHVSRTRRAQRRRAGPAGGRGMEFAERTRQENLQPGGTLQRCRDRAKPSVWQRGRDRRTSQHGHDEVDSGAQCATSDAGTGGTGATA